MRQRNRGLSKVRYGWYKDKEIYNLETCGTVGHINRGPNMMKYKDKRQGNRRLEAQ